MTSSIITILFCIKCKEYSGHSRRVKSEFRKKHRHALKSIYFNNNDNED